jgi:hypothetical protein
VVFRLETGVTGFRHGKEPELPEVPVRRFRGACHEAARQAGGSVGQVAEKTYPRNFHSAVIVGSADRFAVLCNAVYPWVAFVEEGTGDMLSPGVFVDPPACAAAFTGSGFVVLSRRLLESPLSAVDTTALGKGERMQIRSWQPTSVGQAVFHSWD